MYVSVPQDVQCQDNHETQQPCSVRDQSSLGLPFPFSCFGRTATVQN